MNETQKTPPFWKYLVWTLLGSSPLVTTGVLKRDWVLDHLSASVLIAAAYALALAAIGFVGNVWKELEPRWVKSCADWTDAQVRFYLSHVFSRFRRRYYQKLCYRHRVFNVRGLRTQGTFTLELEKVFVELRIAPQNPQEASADPLRGDVLPGNRNIWDFLVSEHDAYRCLAVIGPPGSGKTTLLQHLALTFAQNKQRACDRRCRAFVPILLFLRDHVKAITSDAPPPLAELATANEEKEKTNPPSGWFEGKLKAGKCLVQLDGLDEVADAEQRQKVVAWVDKQVELFGGNRFIVTSRPHGYKSNPLRHATVLEVQPFTMEQVERFVGSWYVANEVLSFGKDDAGVRDAAAKNAADLMRRLRNAPTIAVLAVNPLLLTMIAMVHRYRGALPGRRVELYGEICDVFLGHWRAAVGIVDALTPAQKRTVLCPLAFHLMQRQKRELPVAEAVEVVREPLKRVGGTGSDAPTEFLKAIEKDSGLLLEREGGVYSFAHLTFQEYLSAAHLLETRDEEELLAHVHEPWWHETIRLYAAQGDATRIIRACLQHRDSSLSLRMTKGQKPSLRMTEEQEPSPRVTEEQEPSPRVTEEQEPSPRVTEDEQRHSERSEESQRSGRMLASAESQRSEESPSVVALTLAHECLNEARTVEPDVREALERELMEGFEADDSDRRRLAAEVLLSLRLRNLLRLSDTVEIDTAYVSCAEYQLFLDEKLAAGEYHQPDHWEKPQFPKGAALQPVAGVRHSDAVTFCEWLTQRARAQGDTETCFRLPTPDEARDNPLDPITPHEIFEPLQVDTVGT